MKRDILVLLCMLCTFINISADSNVTDKTVYKTKIKTFNPRFIAIEKNKKTIREAVLWAFIPCGGFVYLNDYSYLALFGSYMIGMGSWFGYSLYKWWDMNRTNRGSNWLSYVYWSGGLLFIGYVLNIIVSAISAKMKIFDDADDISIVVKPSELGKSGGLTFDLNIGTKNI